jgi:hypothetical protein
MAHVGSPRVFVSHSHSDKHFAHRLCADLNAHGADTWIDEADLRIGESLLEKLGNAIAEVDYIGVVLTPRSVASQWVRYELEQAVSHQRFGRPLQLLPILLEPCNLPGILAGRLFADFTDVMNYEVALRSLLQTIGLGADKDEFYRKLGRRNDTYDRPNEWHCIYCGWKCADSNNSYLCMSCSRARPWAGGSATMRACQSCQQFSLAIAIYCEWCGTKY